METALRGPQMGATRCTPPALPDEHNVKEFRLALVCYGGVSLAIYMHGITKELEKLVRASRAFALDRGPNPFPPEQTEHVYFSALEKKAQIDNYRTLVTVDVISGTSAGGINGIYLAKSLAHGASQEALRDLWLKRGSILGLLSARKLLPPLAGKRILGWLQDALVDMDGKANGSLMPPGLTIDLLVTTTDIYGWNRPIPIKDPALVTTVVNKHVLAFHDRDGFGTLDSDHSPALAFAARSTSCFPGAFPPAAIAEITPDVARNAFPHDFCRAYELALPPSPVGATFFIDGGVLDNYPFRNAIRAIPAKPAATEVDRKLLYIEPDPVPPIPPPDGKTPGFVTTVMAGVSKLPRRQPIADALDELSAYNRRVRRVRQMIEATTEQVMNQVVPLLGGSYQDINQAANQQAVAAAGPAFNAYLRLKLYAVVEGMADVICRLLDYPTGTAQAAFVRAVMLRWGELNGILGTADVDAVDLEFLRTFDLGYGRRRLTFTIGRLNRFYPSDRRAENETFKREPLNRAKHRLYELLCRFQTIFDTPAAAPVRNAVETVFGESQLARPLEHWDIDGFLDRSSGSLEELRTALRDFLQRELEGFGDRIYEALVELTADWPASLREDIRAHYLGFPYWDAVTFPARALSDVGELDEVEVIRVSPLDAGKLVPNPEDRRFKLRGVALHHFGAFFRRDWRENDYLWGRLDGVERLLSLLGDTSDASARAGFSAVLHEDGHTLRHIRKLVDHVRSFIAA